MFEAMRVGNKDCERVIVDSWQCHVGREDMHGVMERISRCSEKLEMWNKDSFGNVYQNIKKAKVKLNQALEEDPQLQNVTLQKEIRGELKPWLEKERSYVEIEIKSFMVKGG